MGKNTNTMTKSIFTLVWLAERCPICNGNLYVNHEAGQKPMKKCLMCGREFKIEVMN